MDDQALLESIRTMVAEEHSLREKLETEHVDAAATRQRLDAVQTCLDQTWDLLRQRRAREEFGQDPNTTHLRDGGVVEGYLE